MTVLPWPSLPMAVSSCMSPDRQGSSNFTCALWIVWRPGPFPVRTALVIRSSRPTENGSPPMPRTDSRNAGRRWHTRADPPGSFRHLPRDLLAYDHTIVFATTAADTGLLRVSDTGGTPVTLTRPDRNAGEADHFYPLVLPGGRGVLFTIIAAAGQPRVAVLNLRDNSKRVLFPGARAEYIDAGYLVYAAAGALLAIRFDLDALQTIGDPSRSPATWRWDEVMARISPRRESVPSSTFRPA